MSYPVRLIFYLSEIKVRIVFKAGYFLIIGIVDRLQYSPVVVKPDIIHSLDRGIGVVGQVVCDIIKQPVAVLENKQDVYKRQGETIFTIPAPFMTDADGAYSDAVRYTLVPGTKNREYTLTITADADWMNAGDRAFPVTIDPIVATPQTAAACTVANIHSDVPSATGGDQAQPKVGKYGSAVYRLIMEFDLPELPGTSMMTNAILGLAVYNDTQNPASGTRYLEIYDAGLNQESRPTIQTVCWNNQFSANTLMECDVTSTSDRWIDYDITKLAKNW